MASGLAQNVSSPGTGYRGFEVARSEPQENLPDLPNWTQVILSFGEYRKHSRLGMASSFIAVAMGGLVFSLAAAITGGLVHASLHEVKLLACISKGGIVMTCVNITCLILCGAGVGLAFAGLIASRKRSHIFSWIGVVGNVVVILGMLALDLVVATWGR